MPEYSSLTKEFPLNFVDQTILAIKPDMRYSDLLRYAEQYTRSAIPGLLRKRFLLVNNQNRIIYDEFLSLVNREGINHSVTRKVMYFLWLYRDDRIRRFVIERVALPSGRWSAANLLNKTNADFLGFVRLTYQSRPHISLSA